MKKMIMIAAFAAVAFSNGKDPLTGRWETKPSSKGNVTGVVFKEDNSLEAYVNKKPFASGKYALKADQFVFTDNGCDGKEGVYKLLFFSNNDSLRFVPVDDPCTERRDGMSRLILGRVK